MFGFLLQQTLVFRGATYRLTDQLSQAAQFALIRCLDVLKTGEIACLCRRRPGARTHAGPQHRRNAAKRQRETPFNHTCAWSTLKLQGSHLGSRFSQE